VLIVAPPGLFVFPSLSLPIPPQGQHRARDGPHSPGRAFRRLGRPWTI